MEELGFVALLTVILFIFVLTPATFITSIMINFSRGPKISRGVGVLNLIWALMSSLFITLYYKNMEGRVDWPFLGAILALTALSFIIAFFNLLKREALVTRVLNGLFALMEVAVILALLFYFKVI